MWSGSVVYVVLENSVTILKRLLVMFWHTILAWTQKNYTDYSLFNVCDLVKASTNQTCISVTWSNSEKAIYLNNIFGRIEKVFFLFYQSKLNVYSIQNIFQYDRQYKCFFLYFSKNCEKIIHVFKNYPCFQCYEVY